MFGSIFNTYHGAPILSCTTTDLGIFGTVRGIWSCICESLVEEGVRHQFAPNQKLHETISRKSLTLAYAVSHEYMSRQ